MTAALLLAALQAGTSPPTAPVVPPTPPVASWPSLPLFPLPKAMAMVDGSGYVRGEVEAGRCQVPPSPSALPAGARMAAPVAVLVGAEGSIRRVVPRAIGCPTIEQYTVGYLLSVGRAASATLPPPPGWYQLTVTYRW